MIGKNRRVCSQSQTTKAPYHRWFMTTVLLLIAATVSIFVSTDTRADHGNLQGLLCGAAFIFSIFISTVKTARQTNNLGVLLGTLPNNFRHYSKIHQPAYSQSFWQAVETRRVTSFSAIPMPWLCISHRSCLLPFICGTND